MTVTTQADASPIRSNDQLEHSLLSAWLNVSEVGICVVDNSSRVVMLNAAAAGMLDIDGPQMLNKPLRTLLEAIQLAPGVVEWLATPDVDGGRHASRVTPAGTIELLFRSSTVRAHAGNGTTGLFKMVAITDVTALLTAERRIDSASLQRKCQALNAGVVIVDAQLPDMPMIYVNPMFERMSGYSAAEVVGRNCRYLQREDRDQPDLVAIRTAIRNETNGYGRLRNYRKHGSMFVTELFIAPIKDDYGVVTHFVGIQHLQFDPAVASPGQGLVIEHPAHVSAYDDAFTGTVG
jgi:PAS domain S-box-containing protein